MNIKMISEISMASFFVVFKTLNFLADRKFEKVRALELAVAENSSEDLAKYAKAKHDISVRNGVIAREKKGLVDAVREYKRTSGYDGKKNALYNEAARALEEFKDNLDYDKKILDIQKDMEDSISAYKASVNFDDTIEALDKEISDAMSKWESQKKLLETADDDISEMAIKMKHAYEDAMNETVKKAKEKKDLLEKQLESEKVRFEKKKREAVRDMEEKIAKEKRRLDDKTAKAVNELDHEFENAKSKMLHDIQATRTEEESDCILMAADNEDLVQVQDSNDRLRAIYISEQTPAAERFAWWLKERHWNKGSVIVVGALPVVPAGYLMYRYVKFVFDVANLV